MISIVIAKYLIFSSGTSSVLGLQAMQIAKKLIMNVLNGVVKISESFIFFASFAQRDLHLGHLSGFFLQVFWISAKIMSRINKKGTTRIKRSIIGSKLISHYTIELLIAYSFISSLGSELSSMIPLS